MDRTGICMKAAVMVAALAAAPAGAGGAPPREVTPKVAPDAELLARIAALPANTWMKLPAVKTAGDLSTAPSGYKKLGPKARGYCNKMVWMPDRKRAIYCGGGHNTDPYNDVWEYDLASNTWICLYPADPVPPAYRPGREKSNVQKLKRMAVVKDGAIRRANGAVLRPIHTWWGLCYDPHRRRMLFWDAHRGLFFTDRKALAEALGIDPKDPMLKPDGSGPGVALVFTFYPHTRQWKEVYKAPKAYEASQMEYLPDSRTIWLHSGKTYRLDEAAGTWQQIARNGPPRCAETAYDPKTKALVAVAWEKTYAFADGKWSVLVEKGPEVVRIPHATFAYDGAADRFVLYTHHRRTDGGDTSKPRLWLFDHHQKRWIDPRPQGDVPAAAHVAGYYDPLRNVTVIYNKTGVWVYRCKQAEGASDDR